MEELAPLPVVVKEVGFGLDAEDVRLLVAAGVHAIEVAGAGGTNWALIEGRRDSERQAIAEAFADWGSPTRESLREARRAGAGTTLLASGGLRSGVDVAQVPGPRRERVWPRATAARRRAARPRQRSAQDGDRAGADCDLARGRRLRLGAERDSSPVKAVVVGAGLGGLGVALRLQGAGYEVTVLEQRERPGGRAYQLRDDSFTWDTGPSLITMPWVLEQTFEAGGLDLHREVQLLPLDPFYRIYWGADDRHLDYLPARFFARPFAVRPLPRARAALPVAPAERLPVNLEIASRIRPANLSTKPAALSRDPISSLSLPPLAWGLSQAGSRGRPPQNDVPPLRRPSTRDGTGPSQCREDHCIPDYPKPRRGCNPGVCRLVLGPVVREPPRLPAPFRSVAAVRLSLSYLGMSAPTRGDQATDAYGAGHSCATNHVPHSGRERVDSDASRDNLNAAARAAAAKGLGGGRLAAHPRA